MAGIDSRLLTWDWIWGKESHNFNESILLRSSNIIGFFYFSCLVYLQRRMIYSWSSACWYVNWEQPYLDPPSIFAPEITKGQKTKPRAWLNLNDEKVENPINWVYSLLVIGAWGCRWISDVEDEAVGCSRRERRWVWAEASHTCEWSAPPWLRRLGETGLFTRELSQDEEITRAGTRRGMKRLLAPTDGGTDQRSATANLPFLSFHSSFTQILVSCSLRPHLMG